MDSSTYCLDMDYLLVCIVSRQSRMSVPHLGNLVLKSCKLVLKKKKYSYLFEIKQYVLGALCLGRHHLYSRSLG